MDNKIDSYILEYDNLTEMEKEERLSDIENQLKDLDLYKLMNITFKYSDISNNNEVVSNLLDLIKNLIIERLSDVSLIKVIDLYIDLFNKTLLISDTLMASKNILAVMSYNIFDDDYITREINRKKISKDEYLSMLKQDLDEKVLMINSYTKTHDFLDDLQDKFLIYIEANLQTIESKDLDYLIQNINKRLVDTSSKLLKLKDDLEKPRELDKNELLNALEYNNLKNSVTIYESFRNSLLKENKNDSN